VSIRVASLHVYPVKSCRGVDLSEAQVGRMGIQHDRQWMFVDDRGMFVAQRADGGRGIGIRTMCLIRTSLDGGVLRLTAPEIAPLDVPLAGVPGPARQVQIWDATTIGVDQGAEAARWASTVLSRERPGRYQLVRMPDTAHRPPSTGTASLAFADGYPFLVVSDASLADLNARLDEPLPMNRFRPNIVLGGCDPYEEDRLGLIRIGEVELAGQTRCLRCPIPTTDQDTAHRGKEPLQTLARYRRTDAGVVFGRNFNHRSTGRLAVGDQVVLVGPAEPSVPGQSEVSSEKDPDGSDRGDVS
jgi:hypothetical protein